MCLFKNYRKRKLQEKLKKMQSNMEKIKKLYNNTEKGEDGIVIFLILNPSGNVSELLQNGYNPEILEKFRVTGILNIPPKVSKEECYGRYNVTSNGAEILELTHSLNLLSH